jgi:tetratricopeptide (TPR) repeat protein
MAIEERPIEDGPEGASRAPEPLLRGMCVGRYEIIELVGWGGGGRVYRARDPQLERFVALKLLHPDEAVGAETPARLLQEARTLARLSHPNVVAAYDVGIYEGALFIAMEFIDRTSLKEWLAEPQPRADIVRVLVAAGRGLAAAHTADICHGDFKPANVMIASDERVRVVDFGLARTARAAPHAGEGASDRESGVSIARPPVSAVAGEDTTRWGISTSTALAGTPGFMAPEQLRGQAADARSDQFSYAVTAFLALTGTLPFPATTDPYSPAAFAERRVPRHPKLSRRVRRVLERGLEADPTRRYPSLAEMVTALERAAAPWRPSAWSMGLGAVAASGLALGVALALARRHEQPRCDFDASAFASVWDDQRRSAVEQAFRATGRASQADAFTRISGRLDAFRDEWLRARRDVCEARQVQGGPSERALDLRMACLDGALAGARALVDALGHVDATDVDRVAGGSPPALRACSDAAPLARNEPQRTSGEAPPREREAEIAEAERQIARVSALIIGGFRSASLEQAQLALERARATGHAATIAQATAYMGRATLTAARTSDQRSEGEAWVKESLRLAADSGQDSLTAKTASYLFCRLAYVELRIEESEAMLPMVQAIVERVGNPPESRVQLLMGMGRIAIEHRRFTEAIALLEEARRLAPSAEGEVANYAFLAARDISQARMELGQFGAAVQAAQETVDGIRVVYGPGHPRMLFGLADLAVAQARAGLRDAAPQSIAEARRIATTLPADEPRVKNVARAEGVVWETLGDCARAIAPLREALQLFTVASGASHPLTTGVLDHLSTCMAATGRSAEALAMREQALSHRRQHGAAPASIADGAFALAKALWSDPKRRGQALALIDEAKAIWLEEGATALLDEAANWVSKHDG